MNPAPVAGPTATPLVFSKNPFLDEDFTERITHVEDDLLRFTRAGILAEEPMTDPERRAELIAQGATEEELDTERAQYREAMQALRARLVAFLAATEHLEGPAPTTAPTGLVRESHELPPTV